MSTMDLLVNFKASQALINEYERFWRANGFRNRSDFLRQSADVAMAGGRRGGSSVSASLIIEANLHLGRIGAQMMSLNTKSANSNNPLHDGEIAEAICNVFHELKLIRKRL